MWAMRRSVSAVPAPAGKEWCFEFPVGVDCSDPEPRCIWLAALRNLNVQKLKCHERLTRRNMLYWHLHRVRCICVCVFSGQNKLNNHPSELEKIIVCVISVLLLIWIGKLIYL